MCFRNDMDNLNAYRNKKRPVTVWKKATLDSKTGLATTRYLLNDRVWWKKGTIVYPHKIREPFTCNRSAGAGLYFYTLETAEWLSYRLPKQVIIKATVKPEDIIAVSSDSSIICCVAAKVLDAPDPDLVEMRIKFLDRKIRDARFEIREHREQIKAWAEMDRKEALQQMLDEVKKLKENA